MTQDKQIFKDTEEVDRLVKIILSDQSKTDRANAFGDFCSLMSRQTETHKKMLSIVAVFSCGYEMQPTKEAKMEMANQTLHYIEEMRAKPARQKEQ